MVGSITLLTSMAVVLRLWFLWSFRNGYNPNLQKSSTILPTTAIELSNVKALLLEENKDGIKELVKSTNLYLNPMLRMINENASKVRYHARFFEQVEHETT